VNEAVSQSGSAIGAAEEVQLEVCSLKVRVGARTRQPALGRPRNSRPRNLVVAGARPSPNCQVIKSAVRQEDELSMKVPSILNID
jgi:hypothetical protein